MKRTIPITGPTIGDTIVDATMTKLLFVIKPIPARIHTLVNNDKKTNDNLACSCIYSLACLTRNRLAAFFHSALAGSNVLSLSAADVAMDAFVWTDFLLATLRSSSILLLAAADVLFPAEEGILLPVDVAETFPSCR